MTGDQLSIDDALTELGRVIPSRRTDPGTSHEAAKEIRVKAGSQRAMLLYSFFKFPEGITDEQAMACALYVRETSEFAKRCSELREGGYIEPTGETREGASGHQRIVSRITEKGRRWVSDNR